MLDDTDHRHRRVKESSMQQLISFFYRALFLMNL